MSNFITAILVVIPVLGIMILVHEWGHYIAAKFFKVRVEVFSIGFGKRLFGFRRGETDYRVSALPLGGYVKMSGENPMDERTGEPGEFLSHPRWQRFIIALAGPAMNIILAVVLLTGLFMVFHAYERYKKEPTVLGYVAADSPAAKAGLKAGDRITRIDGITDPIWEVTELKVLLSPELPLELEVRRGGEILRTTLLPAKAGKEQHGVAGWEPNEPHFVTMVDEAKPAHRAGIREGDEIVALDGRPLRSLTLSHRLQEGGGKPVTLTVLRNGNELQYTVIPELVEAEGSKQYRIGLGYTAPVVIEKLPFARALRRSIEVNTQYSKLIFELVGKLIQGKLSLKQVDGPIGIARASGQAFRAGWPSLVMLMALISLNLGIFNLFPIPILDGGVILLLGIESLMRRDISLRVKERIYQAAFVFLILFAAVVIYNDVIKAVPSLSNYLP